MGRVRTCGERVSELSMDDFLTTVVNEIHCDGTVKDKNFLQRTFKKLTEVTFFFFF